MEIKLTFKSNNRTLVIGNDTSYKLVNIEGIDSGSLELNTVSNAQFDGSVVVSKRIQNRPISITVDYKGTNSQEIERQNLISFFNPKNRGVLIVNYGEIERAIEYEVEGFNCKLNSVFDTVSFTVDFMCPNPYWRDIVESKINIAMWRGMFHFPLIIPSTIIPHANPDNVWKDLSGNLNNGLLTGFNFDATSGWTTDGLKFDSDSYVTLPSLELKEGTIQVNNQVVAFDKDVDYRTTSANSNIVSLNTTVDGVMDVELGGNTLQNLFKPSTTIGGSTADGYWYYLNTYPIADLSSRTITLVNPTLREIKCEVRDLANAHIRYEVVQPFNKKVITLETDRKVYAIIGEVPKGWTDTNKTELKGMILEGDWTNKEIPQYFEGIRSVGENESNQIEVLSIGKNLFNINATIDYVQSANYTIENDSVTITSDRTTSASLIIFKIINLKPNLKYVFSANSTRTGLTGGGVFITGSASSVILASNTSGLNPKATFTAPHDGIIKIYLYGESGSSTGSSATYRNIQLEEGTTPTTYEPYKEDKLTLNLTQPLRGLPNNVRDATKDDLVTRNVGKVVLNGSESGWMDRTNSVANDGANMIFSISDLFSYKKPSYMIVSHFKSTPVLGIVEAYAKGEGFAWYNNSADNQMFIYITINKSKLTTQDVAGLKAWLQANLVTVYYQLATPTTESLAQNLKLKSFSNGTLQVNTLIASYLSAYYPITLGGSLASNVSRIDLSNPLIATGLVKNYRVYNKILTTEEIARANTTNYLRGPALLVDLNSSYKELAKTGIIMGLREPSLIVNALNVGNVESGMIIEFKALGTLTNPSILNVETQEFFKVNKSMVAGEIITVNTNVGAKKVIDNLNGVETNILNIIDLDSTFLQLNVGDNLLRYDADTNLNNLEINIYYNPFYLGV